MPRLAGFQEKMAGSRVLSKKFFLGLGRAENEFLVFGFVGNCRPRRREAGDSAAYLKLKNSARKLARQAGEAGHPAFFKTDL